MRKDVYQTIQEYLIGQKNEPYALATVIDVEGSASASLGAQAIYGKKGQRLAGWIGGGCAESFVGEQSVEALEKNQPRQVLADLDDEVFGLGMPCGGKMTLFIQPFEPWPKRVGQVLSQPEASRLRSVFSPWCPEGLDTLPEASLEPAPRSVIFELAQALRSYSDPVALDEVKGPLHLQRRSLPAPEIAPTMDITGQGLFVEALAALALALNWPTRIWSPVPPSSRFPYLQSIWQQSSYGDWDPLSKGVAVVASHHKADERSMLQAAKNEVGYLGLLASRHRVDLLWPQLSTSLPLDTYFSAPCGLDLGSKEPEWMALSVLVQVLHLQEESSEVTS